MNFLLKIFLVSFYKITPLCLLYLISDFVFVVVYYIIGYRKKIVYTNLKKSFPKKTHQEIIDIQKKFFKHLIDLFLVETFKLKYLSKHKINQMFQIINPQEVNNHINKNKDIMLILGHFGNWEGTMNLPLHFDINISAVYNELTNKTINNFTLKTRQRFGANTFKMGDTITYIKELKHEQNMFLFISDQSPHKSRVKEYINFLNQDTPIFVGFEKLSKLYNHAVIYLEILKVKRGKYELRFKTICENAKETKKLQITNQFFTLLENTIKNKPEYWLWSHKRWKHTRD